MEFTFFEDCAKNSNHSTDIIVDFITENPDFLGWRGKDIPDLSTKQGRDIVKEKIRPTFTVFNMPSLPGTIPDLALAKILSKHYNVPDIDRTIREHQFAMGAENFIGYILEMYIFSEAHQHGWCLCPNAIIRSVDFVKKDKGGNWKMLQVKNRDNSENSSSKKVRDGTDISHWFRTFSKKEGSNWNNFPDDILKSVLNEASFFEFIENYCANHPKYLNKVSPLN